VPISSSRCIIFCAVWLLVVILAAAGMLDRYDELSVGMLASCVVMVDG